jgi:S-adenosylmethionine synthetase
MASHLFSSESVTEGHPDKMCDAVSDTVLDACLAADPNSRVACETVTKTGFVMVAGEITTKATLDFPKLMRGAVRDIGYTSSEMGFDAETCGILVAVEQQSPDIAQGVDRGNPETQGAGDQGLMFGYACDETKELMPLPIQLAHQLAYRLAQVRKKKTQGVDWLRPDGKTQVSVRYEDDQIVGIEAIVVSTQHGPEVKHKQIWSRRCASTCIKPVLPKKWLEAAGQEQDPHQPDRQVRDRRPGGRLRPDRPQDHRRHLRRHGPPRRRRVLGQGPVQGRPLGRLLRALRRQERRRGRPGRRCEVQVATRSAWPKPVSMLVQTFGTGVVSDDKLSAAVSHVFDARPGMLTLELDLRRPIYKKTAAYGHFGREEPEFTWEKTPKVDALKDAVNSGNGVAKPAKAAAAGKKSAQPRA